MRPYNETNLSNERAVDIFEDSSVEIHQDHKIRAIQAIQEEGRARQVEIVEQAILHALAGDMSERIDSYTIVKARDAAVFITGLLNETLRQHDDPRLTMFMITLVERRLQSMVQEYDGFAHSAKRHMQMIASGQLRPDEGIPEGFWQKLAWIFAPRRVQ